MSIEGFKSITRPGITQVLVGALVFFTYIGTIDPKVFETLAVLAVGWWFKERSDIKTQEVSKKPAE